MPVASYTVLETGALARQMVAGHPLARDMVAAGGGSVAARVVARLLELVLVLPAMERWLTELDFLNGVEVDVRAIGLGGRVAVGDAVDQRVVAVEAVDEQYDGLGRRQRLLTAHQAQHRTAAPEGVAAPGRPVSCYETYSWN